jgi:hypothetical protein
MNILLDFVSISRFYCSADCFSWETNLEKIRCIQEHMFHGLYVLVKVNNYVLLAQMNVNALGHSFKNTPLAQGGASKKIRHLACFCF